MKAPAVATAAVLLLTTVTAGAAAPPQRVAACSAQVQPNPGFERGTTGWTAGPRIVVLGPAAHTGRAYATFAGLDVTHNDLLRSDLTIPAGCGLDLTFWARGSGSTETSRSDYLNMGLAVTGEPPKTRFSFAYDLPSTWRQYTVSAAPAAGERTAVITFFASEAAGQGTTAFDVDDVRVTLK